MCHGDSGPVAFTGNGHGQRGGQDADSVEVQLVLADCGGSDRALNRSAYGAVTGGGGFQTDCC